MNTVNCEIFAALKVGELVCFWILCLLSKPNGKCIKSWKLLHYIIRVNKMLEKMSQFTVFMDT
jgi:hypothetical protein